MSGRTVIVMVSILALNWGGFAFCLWYGMRRIERPRDTL
jgi:arginine exporter protein ArgO